MNRDQDRQVNGRLLNSHAADRVDENVESAGLDAAVPMQHCEQERQPLCVEADGQSARHRALHRVDERLDFDQQRTRAFERRDNCGSGHGLRVMRQKNCRRIGDALQAALGHCKDAELVRRAEAVLDRAHQPKARMRVAFEVQHRVDDVLQNARPGEAAVLGHVADQHHRTTARFGPARQVRGAFAHLRDRARRRAELIGVDGLDRIDDRDSRPLDVERREDLLELDLGLHPNPRSVQAEPA